MLCGDLTRPTCIPTALSSLKTVALPVPLGLGRGALLEGRTYGHLRFEYPWKGSAWLHPPISLNFPQWLSVEWGQVGAHVKPQSPMAVYLCPNLEG